MIRHASLDAAGVLASNVSDDAIHPWWSFSKTAIAACALVLVSRGELELDIPLDAAGYTLRQLLQHRSGLPDYGPLAAYHAAVARDDEPWAVDRLLRAVRAERPTSAPGTVWRYSNVGYLFARELVERVTGGDLGAAVTELLSVPLGLRSVTLATTRAQMALAEPPGVPPYHPGWVYHGLLLGSAVDACGLLDALVRGRLLDGAARDAMLRCHPIGGEIPGRPWRRTGYGLGVMSGDMTGLGETVGHTGGGPHSVAAVYHFPRCPRPCTVAAFGAGIAAGAIEERALGVASLLQGA